MPLKLPYGRPAVPPRRGLLPKPKPKPQPKPKPKPKPKPVPLPTPKTILDAKRRQNRKSLAEFKAMLNERDNEGVNFSDRNVKNRKSYYDSHGTSTKQTMDDRLREVFPNMPTVKTPKGKGPTLKFKPLPATLKKRQPPPRITRAAGKRRKTRRKRKKRKTRRKRRRKRRRKSKRRR